MPKVVHFEIPADEPERALKFYGDVFGWQASKLEGPWDYWLVSTGEPGSPGINGAVMKRNAPGHWVTNTIDVPSVDEFITRITAAGGTIVVPKMAIPGIGFVAFFKDTEENIFGIGQTDKTVQ